MGREMGRPVTSAMTHRSLTLSSLLLLIGLCLMSLTASCTTESDRSRTLYHDDIVLRPGDLVFRRGTGLTSQAVIAADKEGLYSHVGIVVDSSGVMMVVHAVPGEPDYAGDPDRVKMEPPEQFYSTLNASKGEICRPADSLAGVRAAQAALSTYQRKALFDHSYDSEDTTLVYCTELVVLSYRQAGIELTGPPTHSYNIPGLRCTCWLPSDLYSSDKVTSVCVLNTPHPMPEKQ